MERLCNIDRRVVYANDLPFPFFRRAEFIPFVKDFFYRCGYEIRLIDFKIEIAVDRIDFAHNVVRWLGGGKVLRTHHGAISKYFG